MTPAGDLIRVDVRHGVEFTDGRPIGVVYLVDRSVPLVDRTYALPLCEAIGLAMQLLQDRLGGNDPARGCFRDRDARLIEISVPAAHAVAACRTIGRHVEAATALRARTHREAAA